MILIHRATQRDGKSEKICILSESMLELYTKINKARAFEQCK